MITSKKIKVLDLKKGDLVYSKEEFGIVTKKGRTLFHDHRFVKIKWIDFDDSSEYSEMYFFEDNIIVEKIIAKSKTQGRII